jgi:hypothetical protein
MNDTANDSGDRTFHFSWDGPAEHAPGVLFNPAKGTMPLEAVRAELVGWVAGPATAGVAGNAASEAIRAKVRGVLAERRRLYGPSDLEQLRQHVTAEMMKHLPNGKLTESELQQRIDAFFNDIPACGGSYPGDAS